MNTSAPFMTDITQSDIVKKQRAELYMRIYQYAAEDFVSTADFRTYTMLMDNYLNLVEAELTRLMKMIASHTHIVPPHGKCPQTTTLPTTSPISWVDIPNPEYINTTLTTPNIGGNYVSLSVGSEGDSVPELRRFLPIPVTLKPTLPPIMNMGEMIL